YSVPDLLAAPRRTQRHQLRQHSRAARNDQNHPELRLGARSQTDFHRSRKRPHLGPFFWPPRHSRSALSHGVGSHGADQLREIFRQAESLRDRTGQKKGWRLRRHCTFMTSSLRAPKALPRPGSLLAQEEVDKRKQRVLGVLSKELPTLPTYVLDLNALLSNAS